MGRAGEVGTGDGRTKGLQVRAPVILARLKGAGRA